MRLLKVSQKVVFKKNSKSGIFLKDEEVIFSGYLTGYGCVLQGYLKREPISGNDITLYVKAHWDNIRRELVLLEATKNNCGYHDPIAFCCYIPYVKTYSNEGTGFLDDTYSIENENKDFFFIDGDYIATATIKIEKIREYTDNSDLNEDFFIAQRKINRMINRYYLAKYDKKLHLGHLFRRISPGWCGPGLSGLIGECPE